MRTNERSKKKFLLLIKLSNSFSQYKCRDRHVEGRLKVAHNNLNLMENNILKILETRLDKEQQR